jgi:integrase
MARVLFLYPILEKERDTMAKKKYPKLPNGYGQIRYLGKKRRNPYGVYPPAKYDDDGRVISQKAICYVDTWMKAFSILTSYKAGTYVPGDEKDLQINENVTPDALIQKLLSDYNRIRGSEPDEVDQPTFADVYNKFWKYKYETEKGRKLSKSSRYATQAGFRNCKNLHEKEFRSLRHNDLQSTIDDCHLKHASVEHLVALIKQMYDFAEIYELCDKNYAAHLKINIEDDDESGIPFSDKELKVLWDNINNPIVEMVIIMCYSGYRITAYKTLKVNLTDKYFQGGIKTKSAKDRIVPIHSAIFPLVKKRIKREGEILSSSTVDFRNDMYEVLDSLGIEKHTPHDCRHTFSKLCEDFHVSENDRKRMLGHSFGNDITNKVYGHRDLKDLRTEIEKIKVC